MKTNGLNRRKFVATVSAGSTYSERPAGNNAKWANIPPPQITDITVLNGFYSTLQKSNESSRSNTTLSNQDTRQIFISINVSRLSIEKNSYKN